MTVSLLGSALLCKCIKDALAAADGLRRQQQVAALQSLPAKYHSQLNSMLEFPWSISSGADAL